MLHSGSHLIMRIAIRGGLWCVSIQMWRIILLLCEANQVTVFISQSETRENVLFKELVLQNDSIAPSGTMDQVPVKIVLPVFIHFDLLIKDIYVLFMYIFYGSDLFF